MSSRLSDGAVRGEQSLLWLSRVATEFDEVKAAHGEISRDPSTSLGMTMGGFRDDKEMGDSTL